MKYQFLFICDASEPEAGWRGRQGSSARWQRRDLAFRERLELPSLVSLKPLMRDLGKLEQAMLDLQTKKHALEARLSAPLPTKEIGELGQQLKQIDDELAGHEEKWLALSEQIKAAGA